MGLSIPAGLCRLAPPALRLGQRRMLQGKAPDIPEHVLRLAGVGPDKLRAEWSMPGFITMFLPEFPHRTVPGHEHFQVDLNSIIDTNNGLIWLINALHVLFPPFHLDCDVFAWLLSVSVSVHQVLSYIAKGSFGPILKVKDKTKQKTYAVKVSLLPDSHILNACIWLIKAVNEQPVY